MLQPGGKRLFLLLAALFALAGGGLLLALPLFSSPAPAPVSPAPPGEVAAAPSPPPPLVRSGTVRRGDTLQGLLRAQGVPDALAARAARMRAGDRELARVVTGRPYRFLLREGDVEEFQYEPDAVTLVRVSFPPAGPAVSCESIPVTAMTVTVRGVIDDNLFGAVEAAGEDPSLALDLAETFAWQIDFFRDTRRGDSFSVLVEKVLREGRFVRYGRILAAEFVNRGRRHTAFSWEGGDGRTDYFDEQGYSLRKEFLKAPLRFRRVSSSFSYSRRHPVLKQVRAHLGTDYSAPVGTPVRAIGDGRVTARAKDPANGRMVKVRHNGTYTSAYAHLDAWAAGIAVGSAVVQGEVIGFVGSSGLSTGPHLHFALYRDGRMVDPRRVETPRAAALEGEERGRFLQTAEARLSLLAAGAAAGKLASR
jgi:murein DD-endopeptidase MepM/ murein hydrolase activator NlpD